MRRLYLSATLIFWLLVSAFWAGSVWLPRSDGGVADAPERVISTAELARHALAEDCWMAIRGQVHDLGAYLPEASIATRHRSALVRQGGDRGL
jgi:hypothetical protein